MGRKKKSVKRDLTELEERAPSISSEAVRGVCAIFFIAIAGFLVLAEFGSGGAFGGALYEWLSWLLGVGYTLLPFSLCLLAILIFRSFDRRFGWVQLISMGVFLLAGLGLINLAFPSHGGILGALVSNPIVAAVDTIATIIFLCAFLIVSLIVAFDVNLRELLQSVRGLFVGATDEQMQDIEDVPVVGLPEEEQEVEEEFGAADVIPAPSREEPAVHTFATKTSETEGFPIIAATGLTYSPPPVSILAKNRGKPEVGDVKANMNIIKRTLQNFGIQVEMDEASIGPTVTRYSMKPAEGVRLSKIVALQSNLELALAASPVRIEAPIPGKSLVGIEVPNIARTTLVLAPLVSDEASANSHK